MLGKPWSGWHKRVGFQGVILIQEPNAALLHHSEGVLRKVSKGIKEVVDLGGGTLDVAILRREDSLEMLASAGARECGGVDFTKRLADHVAAAAEEELGVRLDRAEHGEEYHQLLDGCETAKHRLCKRGKATVSAFFQGKVCNVELTLEQAKELWSDLLEEVIATMERAQAEAGVSRGEIGEVILTGGASLNPCVQEVVSKFLGKQVNQVEEPFHSVVLGAALFCWQEGAKRGLDLCTPSGTRLPRPGFDLRNRTAHAIGVIALDNGDHEVFEALIEKGVPIENSEFSRAFGLAEEGQTACLLRIMEQAAPGSPVAECDLLGEVLFENLRPIHGEIHRIGLTFRLDENGIVTVIAEDQSDPTKAPVEGSVSYTKSTAAA